MRLGICRRKHGWDATTRFTEVVDGLMEVRVTMHTQVGVRELFFSEKMAKKVPSEWTLGSIATAADQRH